jgi:aspartyl-tRNA(Asn)/glutamyl-tRNA(Gln) amidotransferase subunit C
MMFEQEKVEKIAQLARLALNNEEKSEYAASLEKILLWVEQLNVLDTSAVKEMGHPLALFQPLRLDIVTEENQKDNLMALAPRQEAGLYLVPKVIE